MLQRDDGSVSLRLDHHFEGLFLNSIPGIRSLNWRLVATANVLYGSLSEANTQQPRKAPDGNDILPIPPLGRLPYVEVGYGIENIFKFIRVDFIHRVTYREQPAVITRTTSEHMNFGIKVGAQFRL